MVNPCIGSDPSASLTNNTVLTIWLVNAMEVTVDDEQVENKNIDQQKKRKAEGSKPSQEAEKVTVSPSSFSFKCYGPPWGIDHCESLQVQLLASHQVKTSQSSPHGSWHIVPSGTWLYLAWHWVGDEKHLHNHVFRRIPNTPCWQRINVAYGSDKGSHTFLMPWKIDDP